MSPSTRLPAWAPRVSRRQIERFYKVIGKGIIDEDAIDDLGVSLYARCKSVVEVREAIWGTIICPECRSTFRRHCRPGDNETMTCPDCEWACEWKDYKKTYKGKLLNGGNMVPFCREYEQGYGRASSYREKIVLIDTLIHRFHDELVGGNTPGAYILIEGEICDVAAFLDRINYGDEMPDEVRARRETWREKVRTTKRFWSEQLETEDTD